MERYIRAGAYLGNTILIVVAFFIAAKSYNNNQIAASLLMTIPPILSLIAIYCGPDREERALRRSLTKARMRRELQEIEGMK